LQGNYGIAGSIDCMVRAKLAGVLLVSSTTFAGTLCTSFVRPAQRYDVAIT
jgi:hypothetical protein